MHVCVCDSEGPRAESSWHVGNESYGNELGRGIYGNEAYGNELGMRHMGMSGNEAWGNESCYRGLFSGMSHVTWE